MKVNNSYVLYSMTLSTFRTYYDDYDYYNEQYYKKIV